MFMLSVQIQDLVYGLRKYIIPNKDILENLWKHLWVWTSILFMLALCSSIYIFKIAELSVYLQIIPSTNNMKQLTPDPLYTAKPAAGKPTLFELQSVIVSLLAPALHHASCTSSRK